MNQTQLLDYLKSLLTVGADEDKWNDRCQGAMTIGFQRFWSAHPWSFRRKKDTLTTTSTQSYLDLPGDFEKEISARLESSQGRRLEVLEEGKFDHRFPYPDSEGAGKPNVVKIVWDGPKQPRMYFSRPMDSAYSIVLAYNAVGDLGNLGNVKSWGLACCVDACRYYLGILSIEELLVSVRECRMKDGVTDGVGDILGNESDVDDFNHFGTGSMGNAPIYD